MFVKVFRSWLSLAGGCTGLDEAKPAATQPQHDGVVDLLGSGELISLTLDEVILPHTDGVHNLRVDLDSQLLLK